MYELDVDMGAPGFERVVPRDAVLERVSHGLKVDVEGNVDCTGPGGIHVFDPADGLLCRLLMPGPPANFGWGDPDFRGMYVTAREMLYRVRLGVAGVPHGPHNRRKALAAARS